MPDETSLDLVGMGKLAKAIPPKAWVQLVDTACVTFREAISPITNLTGGIGRLIEARFDRLVDVEKVLAAETVANAQRKAKQSSRKPSPKVKPTIIIAAIEGSSAETDPVLRELWANLLAKEFVSGAIHPEFPIILTRLSSSDAQELAYIAEHQRDKSVALHQAINSLLTGFKVIGVKFQMVQHGSFTHEHLQSLGLILKDSGAWQLTLTGKAFIESVSHIGAAEQAV